MKPEAEKEDRRSPARWSRISAFISVVWPGFITANVDNDAGGLTTYSQAGARFGLKLMWVFLPVTVLLIMVQEMVNRMGVFTGQGLSDMIRERFGVKITFYLMLAVLATNLGNVMAEFAGIASAGQIFGLPALLTVPFSALLVWLLVLRWSYTSVEKVFLLATVFYLAYPITFVLLKPDLKVVGLSLVSPRLELSSDYLVMLIGLVGTTIAPWMQFYQQASVVEKNIAIQDYPFSRLDTVLGGLVVNIVAACIVVTCALTLHPAGVHIHSAGEAAQALAPLAGRGSAYLFAIGLGNASLFAASILPLSTAYSICEALGWESGVDRDFAEAPHFYVLYTAILLLGALTVLIPGISLIKVMFWSQVVNGLLLPLVLVGILILINDQKVMHQRVNSGIYNAVCWIAALVLTLISLAYVAALFLAPGC